MAEKLTVTKRDELLIRMDERVKALKDGDEGDVPEIKKHMEKQNGRIRKLEITVACLIVGGGSFSILEWQDVIHVFGG